MNSVNLIGRLTKDPEMSYSQAGMAITTATIAVNRAFKSQDGVEADFIRIKAFKKTAELIANIKKGERLGVSGSWQTGSYDNTKGERVYTNDCIVNQLTFIETKGSGNSNGGQYQHNNNQNQNQGYQNQQNNNQSQGGYQQQRYGGQPINIQDDDLPF
ncbi:single-stranded DNA-binding protein [Carnobacterium jeotgali]|uniref:single-stranded DNA-binding protein n=1 Tax=Carnobacterium jeotgali TaxID=545534 RepID=UPI00049365FD|nr:single-stranded DNA-binding protein [Carnobacterium jeotgali]